MKLDLFANRISRVLFVGGVVRIEFCLLEPDEKGEVNPETPVGPDDVHFTVTLPLNGYTRSVGELRKFTQDLQSKGVIKQQDQQGGGQPQAGGGQAGGQQGAGGRQGGRPGGGQGGRPHREAQPEKARRQRELTDLTRDNGEEPLV